MRFLLLLSLAVLLSACATTTTGPQDPAGTITTLMSKDFPYEDSDFYLDNFTGMPLLALNPNLKKTGAIAHRFLGQSGRYDIVFYGIGESDGQSAFEILVNDKTVGKKKLPLSTEPWEAGEAFNFRIRNVKIKAGNEIVVQGIVGTDGEEFSRARWLKMELVRR
ncbi:hypothetical protein SAMN05444359_10189 [Neolewinella agarilytica]|uniref:Uncharacterized protein n=2 Tax=Neolewinella agarilytica TaxID=478744 RepID=A0A1H8YYH9_9BACT|nr:hypothetical protein SAMN05444359_10189 [Neolewinella agarilytica]